MRTISCLLLFTAALVARAESPATRTIVGDVRYQGKPVAGASARVIWRPTTENEMPPFAKPVATDASGRFTISWTDDPAKLVPHYLFVRDSHGRFGFLDVYHQNDLHLEPYPRIELHDVGDAHGRLTDTSGAPIKRARIKGVAITAGLGESSYGIEPPPELAAALNVTTGDDGRFTMKGIPVDGRIGVEVAAPGYGNVRLMWRRDVPCDVRLEKAGTARIQFEGVTDAAKFAGAKFRLDRKMAAGSQAISFYAFQEVTARADPTLSVPDMVPGNYTISRDGDWNSPYLLEKPIEFVVPPDGVGEVSVTLTPAAEVRGKVIDVKTRKGLAGASIWVSAPADRGHRQAFALLTADSAGAFRAFVTPGDLGTYVQSVRSGYLPEPDDAKPVTAIVAAGKSHTFPDIALEPAVPVAGIVVDSAGRPLAAVTVHSAHNTMWLRVSVTDALGRFRLTDLGPDESTALRARTATATTDGAVPVSVADLKGPIKLVVSEASACRLRGRVVNPDGKPIADAAVRIEWRYQGAGRSAKFGVGSNLSTYRTNTDGTFETIALWPGDGYKVHAEAPGFGKAEAAQVTGVAGQLHDIGTIVLPRTGGTVAGTVVDTRGRPVPGIRVFNEGDGPKPLSTSTDDDGRFRLEGFFGGDVYVFARKSGHRFTTVRAKSGDAKVLITLRTSDETPPTGQPEARPAAHVAAEKKLTLHLLDRLWELPDGMLGGFRNSVLTDMARFDLDRARRAFDERRKRGEAGTDKNSRLSHILLAAEAERTAATDAAEAIGMLAPLPADSAYRVLLDLGRRYRTLDPLRARLFAEVAVTKARAMQLPGQVWSLADAGDLMVQLGHRDAGLKILNEAADQAETLGRLGINGLARGMVAARLVRFDLARAKSLIFQVDEANRWQAEMAVRMAEHDFESALALLKDVKADNSSIGVDTRRRMAVGLARSGKWAEAAKFAESIEDAFRPKSAMAAVAVVIGQNDPALSRSLIERSLDLYIENPAGFLSSQSYRATLAAWIAYQARLAGHPDLQSVVGRVLACRLTTQWDSAANIAAYHAKDAMTLALTDPVTAQRMLERAVPRDSLVPGGLQERREWLLALAMADPERAIAEVDRRIELAKSGKASVAAVGLIELLGVLTQPTEVARYRLLAAIGDALWPQDELE